MAWQSTLKVSISGVRGIVGDSLSMTLVSQFAEAFGNYVGRGRVVVGRDTRPTGEMLEHAVVAGLLAVGCEPVMLGIAPTPTLLILVNDLKARGGIAITASHNPIEWNALKFVNRHGLFLDQVEATELLDMYHQSQRGFVEEGDLATVTYRADPFTPHRERIYRAVDQAVIRAARLKVVVDCCNGAGAPYAPDFLRGLGCEVIALHDEVRGVFERGPEPVPAHLGALGEAVRRHGAAVGFALDPDADRLALVGPDGQPLGENYTLVLAVAHALSRQPGLVATNISTSKAVEDVTRAAGGTLLYTRIGEINVSGELVRRQGLIGGEGNGGVIWPAVHPCRDSFTAMALVLEMMATRRQGLDAIMATMPHYHSVSLKVACPESEALRVVRELRERYADREPNTLDGIRIDWDDRWVLVRPSNTEPILRIFTEARDPAGAQELADTFQAAVRALLAAGA